MNGSLSAEDKEIIIVISEFNPNIIERLLQGALDAFIHHGGKDENIRIFRVPGAFEIPGTVQQVIQQRKRKPDGIVALGAVIRGQTSHFDYIAGESARGIAEISRNADIPIINGILTTDNRQQALERSDSKGINKGWNAMEAVLKTISVYQDIQATS